jgi:predicted RNase H-like HicB family nuclease
MKSRFFPVVIEQDEDGFFADCPALQGCHVQGKNYEETLANLRDAVQLHIEDRWLLRLGHGNFYAVAVPLFIGFIPILWVPNRIWVNIALGAFYVIVALLAYTYMSILLACGIDHACL